MEYLTKAREDSDYYGDRATESEIEEQERYSVSPFFMRAVRWFHRSEED